MPLILMQCWHAFKKDPIYYGSDCCWDIFCYLHHYQNWIDNKKKIHRGGSHGSPQKKKKINLHQKSAKDLFMSQIMTGILSLVSALLYFFNEKINHHVSLSLRYWCWVQNWWLCVVLCFQLNVSTNAWIPQ